MLYYKRSGRRLLQHELARVACDSRDSRNMKLQESCATLVKFDEFLPLYWTKCRFFDESLKTKAMKKEPGND